MSLDNPGHANKQAVLMLTSLDHPGHAYARWCTNTLCQLIFNGSDSVNIDKLQKRTHLLYDHENEMLLTLSKTLTNLESSS